MCAYDKGVIHVNKNSSFHMCMLDASKAFDIVNVLVLF